MAKQATKASSAVHQKNLATFADALLGTNPFSITRVSDPSQMASDVESIHAEAFNSLTALASAACTEERGIGALLVGGAGVGKSHLLARFARWAAAQNACYVFLHNIQVNPEDVDRYLLKCVVSKLTQDRLHGLRGTPLFHLVDTAIRQAAIAESITTLNGANREEVFERLAKRLGGDRDVFNIVFRFFHSAALSVEARLPENRTRHDEVATLAARWLQGDLLDAEEVVDLGIKVPPGQQTVQLQNDQVEAVLLTISRLACANKQPFIICIDQADNMREDQLRSLTQSLHSLIDHAQNLLVVVSGVRSAMYDLIDRRVIPEAAADRLEHRRPIEIRRLTRSEARQLVEDRLIQFLTRHEGVPEVKARFQRDRLFPLGEEWFNERAASELEIRARDALNWASEAWQAERKELSKTGVAAWLKTWPHSGPGPSPEPTIEEILAAIDAKVTVKVEESVSAPKLQPETLPTDAANLTGLVHEVLRHCLDRNGQYTLRRIEPRHKKTDTLDLMVHEQYPERAEPWKNGVLFVATGSKTSAAVKLKHLMKAVGPDNRVLVTDEQRLPLPLGPSGKQYLATLEKMGPGLFTRINLNLDQYARLDAILAVVGLAKCGDLEVEIRRRIIRVTEEQVIEAHHRAGRYASHPLLRVFLTKEDIGPPPPPPRFPPEKEFKEFVCARLALHMGMGVIELLRCFTVETRSKADVEQCLDNARNIVLEMHQQGLVFARPWDEDLILTLGTEA